VKERATVEQEEAEHKRARLPEELRMDRRQALERHIEEEDKQDSRILELKN
jgi:hypothetical protein